MVTATDTAQSTTGILGGQQSSALFDVVNQQVQSIRDRLATQQLVEFVAHAWMPFPNLATNGFKFSSIKLPEIPRLTLCPIVAYPETLFGSRLDTEANKYVPAPIEFQQNVGASLVDLDSKFSKYGLIHLRALSTDLDGIEAAVLIFETVVSEMRKLPLQEHLRYLGETSPVETEFTILDNRVSVERGVIDVIEGSELTYDQKRKAYALVDDLKTMVNRAHRKALIPPSGVLPVTIDGINKGRKFKPDSADEWLLRQFPAFDMGSKYRIPTPRPSENKSEIKELLEGFTKIVNKAVGGEQAEAIIEEATAQVATVVEATTAPVEVVQDGDGNWVEVGEGESSAAPSQEIIDLESILDDPVVDTLSDSDKVTVGETEFDKVEELEDEEDEVQTLCSALTAKGKPCKAYTLVGSDYCFAHQQLDDDGE